MFVNNFNLSIWDKLRDYKNTKINKNELIKDFNLQFNNLWYKIIFINT